MRSYSLDYAEQFRKSNIDKCFDMFYRERTQALMAFYARKREKEREKETDKITAPDKEINHEFQCAHLARE